MRFTDRILIERIAAPDRSSYIENVPMYVASTVPVAGFDIGFAIDLDESERFFVGLDAQVRYQGKPKAAAETFSGLVGLNDGGQRWSAPVFLTVGLRF